jgi:hypothetical protein
MALNKDEPELITIEMAFRDVDKNDIKSVMDDLKTHITEYIKKYKIADKMTAIDVW